jgi:transcriptional regulator with PAS, ATPase and Fis domain
MGKKKPTPPKELLIILQGYSFPGNIRELQSMIFDAVSSHRSGILSMETFRPHMSQKQPMIGSGQRENVVPSPMISFHDQLPTLKEIEELLVTEAMRRAGNNQSIAAMSLGISRQALNKRLIKMKQ